MNIAIKYMNTVVINNFTKSNTVTTHNFIKLQ